MRIAYVEKEWRNQAGGERAEILLEILYTRGQVRFYSFKRKHPGAYLCW